MVRAALLQRASSGRSGFVRMLIVLAAIAALVQIVRFAISDQVAIDEPELALTLDGRNWKALMVQAEKALREERSDDAARDVRSALRADPLAGGALRALGIIEQKHGSAETTERLMRAAADVSRRDAIAQAWLLGQNLQSGDLAQAMSRLDLIFRIQNSGAAKLVSLLLPLLSHDEARRELATRLAARPPWRSGFLNQVAREAPDLNAISALYSALNEARPLRSRKS